MDQQQILQTIQEAANSLTSSKLNLGLATDYLEEVDQDVTNLVSLKNA